MDLYGHTVHVVETDDYRFTWRGGEYVEISVTGAPSPGDVINVWDYESGLPRIPFTLDALLDRVTQWFKDQAEAEADT